MEPTLQMEVNGGPTEIKIIYQHSSKSVILYSAEQSYTGLE